MAAKTAKPVIDYPTTELGMLRAAIAEATERGDTEWAAFLTGKLPNFGGASEIPAEEIKEQGNSNGDTSSRHQAKGNGLTTPRQLEWLIKLHQEKLGINLLAEGNESLLAAVKNLTVKNASATMTRMFAMPRWEQVQAATAAQGHTPIAADAPSTEVAPVEAPADPKVLPGRYVVEGKEIRVSQGKKGSQWFGTTFVREIESDRLLKGEARRAVLEAIAANPAECAREYTKLTGRCTCCTRELINAESIEASMGPICSGKFGRMYGVTILGETYVEKPKRAKKAAAPVVIEAEVLEGEIVEPIRALPAAPVAEPTRSIAKGTAATKAQKVMAALDAIGAKGSLAVSGETTVLTSMVDGKALQVTWDGVSFRYGADSTLGGKKFRNVSELLRLIA